VISIQSIKRVIEPTLGKGAGEEEGEREGSGCSGIQPEEVNSGD